MASLNYHNELCEAAEVGFCNLTYISADPAETEEKLALPLDSHYEEIALHEEGRVKHVVFKEHTDTEYESVHKIKFTEYKVCDVRTRICTVIGCVIITLVSIALYFAITRSSELRDWVNKWEQGDYPHTYMTTNNTSTYSDKLLMAFKVLNVDYESAFEDSGSKRSMDFVFDLKKELRYVIDSNDILSASVVAVENIRMQKDMSVQVLFYCNQEFKMEELENLFEEVFLTNTRTASDWNIYIGEYLIERASMSFTAILGSVISTHPPQNVFHSTSVTDNMLTSFEITVDKPCETINIPLCSSLSYHSTKFPNQYGHVSQAEVANVLHSSLKVVLVSSCNHQVADMLCRLLLPPCIDEENYTIPCQEFCQEFHDECDPYSPNWMIETDCLQYPLSTSSEQCFRPKSENDLKIELVNGSSSNEGLILATIGDQSGYVCDRGWSDVDADVVCRHFNITFMKALATRQSNANINYKAILQSLNCIGNENSIAQCQHTLIQEEVCNAVAGVTCLTEELDTTSTTNEGEVDMENTTSPTPKVLVRLVDGPSEDRGRLEVLHNGTWGTVCQNMFNDNAAKVVCKMLGLRRGTYMFSRYGEGEGVIAVSDVFCSGEEESVFDCFYGVPAPGDCSHREDVSIACEN